MSDSRARVPARPMSSKGWRTVVGGGALCAACDRSSKPTIDRLSGMDSPSARAASLAPRAIGSAPVTMAVGRCVVSRWVRRAGRPGG